MLSFPFQMNRPVHGNILAMDAIRGQDRAIGVLRTQHQLDRLHHAYIFHGPAGIGKFTTALAFGRMLIGTDQDTHADLHIITKELAKFSDDAATRNRKLTSIPVSVLRSALVEPVYRSATVPGGRKVFIVDEAELLNDTGQNLLLKTLEEPPAGTTLILVTSSEDRLLPTIRSRCQRVAFATLPQEVVARWLDENAAELSDTERAEVLTFAQGSIGRANLAMEYGLTDWVSRVLPAMDQMARGRPDGELGGDIANFLDSFAKTWVEAHDNNASKEAANQLGATLMWSMIEHHAATRLREVSGGGEAACEPWLNAIDAAEEARRMLGANVNLALVCDHLAAQLAGCLEAAG